MHTHLGKKHIEIHIDMHTNEMNEHEHKDDQIQSPCSSQKSTFTQILV